MSPPSDEPLPRALTAIRSWVCDGRFRPGARLQAVELAAELRLSATPVREALSRLAGEGLLEDRRREGFFVRRLTAAEIADLHRLSLACLLIALDPSRPRRGEPAGAAEPAGVPSAERLLAGLVRAGGSRALLEAFQAHQARLAPVRRLEAHVFPDLGLEAERLARSARAGGAELVARVRTFHLRRIGHAEAFGELLEREAQP